MAENLQLNWVNRAEECARRWSLTDIIWRPDVSTAHVGLCDSPLGPAVVKVSIEPRMVGPEALALSHFGESCPKVYGVAEDCESLLLERIDVAEDLSATYPSAQEEIEVFLPFLKSVLAHSNVPTGFPTLQEYADVFSRVKDRSPNSQVTKILDMGHQHKAMLMGTPSENRLLHGDMHHFNILRDVSGRWRLIDPHGVVGYAYYELGAFLRNPWKACYTEPGVLSRLAERVAMLAVRLGISESEVAMWGFYGAAFSVAWSLEDGSADLDGMVVMAESCLSLA